MSTKESKALFTAIEILIDKNDIDGVRKILNVVLKPKESKENQK